jgi:hypothetical protein
MNTQSSLTWSPNKELKQGIYAFFILSPNHNSSESPFFTLQVANSTSSGLSKATKVGIGLGVPFGLSLLALFVLVAWLLWRRVGKESRREQETLDSRNEMTQMERREIVELGGTSVGPELPAGEGNYPK